MAKIFFIILVFQVPKGEVRMTLEAIEDYGVYTKTEIVELKNIKAPEIEPFIKARLSKFGSVQTNDFLNALIITDYEPKLKDLVNLIKELDKKGIKEFVRLETEIIPVKHVLPSSVAQLLESRLSPDGIIQFNDELNILIVTDVKSKIEDVKRILQFLDFPPPEILLYGRVIEMEEKDGKELGVDVFGILEKSYINTRYEKTYTPPLKQEEYFLGIGNQAEIIKNIQQLILKEKAKVVSEFNIKVLNNKEGKFALPPYFNLTTIPQIGSEGSITLKLKIVAGLGKELVFPHFTQKLGDTLFTTIRVKDKDTLLIGGIKIEKETKEIRGVPLLSEIPLLGYLFKREIKTKTEKNLIVIITPHIIK